MWCGVPEGFGGLKVSGSTLPLVGVEEMCGEEREADVEMIVEAKENLPVSK